MTAQDVTAALQIHASVRDAEFLQRFFKTGAGEYGEGDIFIGVRVPPIRIICKRFTELSLEETQKLLDSSVHEHRLAALIILTIQYPKATEPDRQKIYDFYLKNTYAGRINNWDLVDVSADLIIGEHLLNRPRTILFELASSENMWQKRVAILSSFRFIKAGDPTTTLELAKVLLQDPHDLIQKAVGWMLREVGKRGDQAMLTGFLDQHAAVMPRTMLRYSLERLPPQLRNNYMRLK
jgi:3-methyladenine DNA glycosylase AlkD